MEVSPDCQTFLVLNFLPEFWLLFQNAYEKHKEVVGAQGVKIIAKDLEKSLAGLPLYVAEQQDEVEVWRVSVE